MRFREMLARCIKVPHTTDAIEVGAPHSEMRDWIVAFKQRPSGTKSEPDRYPLFRSGCRGSSRSSDCIKRTPSMVGTARGFGGHLCTAGDLQRRIEDPKRDG